MKEEKSDIRKCREANYQAAIQPIYDRAGRATAIKTQTHLRQFEEGRK